MKPRKNERIFVTPRQQASLIFMGVILLLPGLAALFGGRLFYRDYRELLVFAPFTMLIGLVMIIFAVRIGNRR